MTGPPDERSRRLVIAPARPGAGERGGKLAFELRQLADGRVALPVFSTVAELVRVLGRYQPWVCVPLGTAEEAISRAGISLMVLDPDVDSRARRWTPAGLERLRPPTAGRGGDTR
jgi:SseB protein N-terminal domain